MQKGIRYEKDRIREEHRRSLHRNKLAEIKTEYKRRTLHYNKCFSHTSLFSKESLQGGERERDESQNYNIISISENNQNYE